ncbi:MAG: hypothetical protein ACR2PT_20855 [Endozoicomonas sp.]
MLAKKATLAVAVAAATFTMSASALTTNDEVRGVFDDAQPTSIWDSFVEGSSMDMKVRSSNLDMKGSSVDVNTSWKPTSNELISDINNFRKTDEGSQLASKLIEEATGQAIPPELLKNMPDFLVIRELQKFINEDSVNALVNQIAGTVGNEVRRDTTLGQFGMALWGHFQSGYLFDVVGFDLGFHAGSVWNDYDKGNMMHTGDKNMARLSIANVKFRFGDEDRHFGFRTGRMELDTLHFGRDNTEWLLDKNFEGSMVNAKWDGLNVYGLEVTARGEFNSEDFVKYEDVSHFERAGVKKSHTLGADYYSDYGMIRTARTESKNYLRTDSFEIASGLPMHMVGFDVPEGKEMDHLFVFQVNGNWQKAHKDFVNPFGKHLPDHNGSAVDFLIGAQWGNLFFGASYLQVGKNGFYEAGFGGGGMSEILAGETLINGWSMPNQRTYTYVASYNWADLGNPGLTTQLISANSRNIDMDAVRESGDMIYYLVGKEQFQETLFEVRYSPTEGMLDGLTARFITGFESNIGSMSGWGAFIDYDFALF